MRHEKFAERAARRLEAVADRLEEEGRVFDIDGGLSARAGELRVAALITRDEARAVTRVEGEPSAEPPTDTPPLEAQA
jgi:hypothetical protein